MELVLDGIGFSSNLMGYQLFVSLCFILITEQLG